MYIVNIEDVCVLYVHTVSDPHTGRDRVTAEWWESVGHVLQRTQSLGLHISGTVSYAASDNT